MPDRERESMGQWLQGLARGELIGAYDKLYLAGGVPKEEAGSFLGPELVKELTDRGLAHVVPHTETSGPTFQATQPDLAMMTLLADLQTKALGEHEQLLDGYRRLAELQTRAQARSCAELDHFLRIVRDPEEILKLSLNLPSTARKEWMTLETLDSKLPVTEDYRSTIPAARRAEVRVRSIYEFASTEHPIAALNMQRCIEEGDEARILPTVPMKMLLADMAIAMLPLDTTGTGGAILIRAVPILRALREYFEMLWKTARPAGCASSPPTCPLSEQQYQIVKLMAQGMTDKQIRSRLKFAERTMTRHVELIMETIGTDSRFAAGVIAQRRGWLDRTETDNG